MWASNSTPGRIADPLGITVTDLLDIQGLTDDREMRTPDSAPAIRKNRRLPRGLRDLASDKLSQALKIKALNGQLWQPWNHRGLLIESAMWLY